MTVAPPVRPDVSSPEGAAAPRAGLSAVIERRTGLTASGQIVAGLAVLIAIAGRSMQNRGMFLAAYGLAFIVIASWLMGRRRIGIGGERSDLPTRLRPGQVVEGQITLTADKRVATVVVEEHLHPHLGVSLRVPVPLLSPGQAVTHAYTFSPRVRGVYQVGPMIAESSDPSGLTRRRQEIGPVQTVIVHPRTEPVLDRILARAWEDPPVRPPELKPWPTGLEFYGLREYVPGDDPRRIVWRAVAQYDQYLVRESEQGVTDRVNLVLDTERDGHSPGVVSATFEAAVSVVASMTRKHLRDGFGVTIETNDGTVAADLRGSGRLIAVMDKLAEIERGNATVTDTLDRLLASGSRGAHTVFVASRLTPQATSRLRMIGDAGGSMLLVLCVWDETDPATFHRAGLLGCSVVEVHPAMALGNAFAHVAGRRS